MIFAGALRAPGAFPCDFQRKSLYSRDNSLIFRRRASRAGGSLPFDFERNPPVCKEMPHSFLPPQGIFSSSMRKKSPAEEFFLIDEGKFLCRGFFPHRFPGRPSGWIPLRSSKFPCRGIFPLQGIFSSSLSRPAERVDSPALIEIPLQRNFTKSPLRRIPLRSLKIPLRGRIFL